MSSTDTRTVDPAQPHHSENGGHEMSDFSWTTVLWLLPIAVIVLVVFFGVSIAWFKGAKDRELDDKQAVFVTTELNQLHAKENETMTQYKLVDKDKGRYQIPVARAMELIVQEHQNTAGKAWTPIMDTYLEGAPFKSKAKYAPESEEAASGISIETDDTHASTPAAAAPAPVHGDGKDKSGSGKSAHEKAH
jgi:hypothetical protein